VDVDQSGNCRVTPQIEDFCSGRNFRRIGGDVHNALATDDYNRIGPHFALAVDEFAEAQGFSWRIGGANASSAAKCENCQTQRFKNSAHIHLE
jgi:hypothetical protein